MSIIRRIPNYEHTARAVAAIRARWEAEASYRAFEPVVEANVVPMRRRAVSNG